MLHALEISEAFEKIDSGPGNSCKFDREVAEENLGHAGSGSSLSKAGQKAPSKGDRKGKRSPPTPCPLPKCKVKNLLHCIADCQSSTDKDKRRYKEEVPAAKAGDGTARSVRSQTSNVDSFSKSVDRFFRRPDEDNDSPSCQMTVSDVASYLDVVGRCCNRSDENIASHAVAEETVL